MVGVARWWNLPTLSEECLLSPGAGGFCWQMSFKAPQSMWPVSGQVSRDATNISSVFLRPQRLCDPWVARFQGTPWRSVQCFTSTETMWPLSGQVSRDTTTISSAFYSTETMWPLSGQVSRDTTKISSVLFYVHRDHKDYQEWFRPGTPGLSNSSRALPQWWTLGRDF